MQTNNHVKTVLYQASPVSGDLRLRESKWVAGERKTENTLKEHGCIFKVDLRRCYFSLRLSYERMRIVRQARPNEVIVNMFAGVGCFSIRIAKYVTAKKVYFIDINPNAVRCTEENVRLNKVKEVVEPFEGDSIEVIQSRLRNIADRVLMPLPERAYEYPDYAVMALRPEEGIAHYYGFIHARKD
jgi:tRNA (guanine37-N1)-methyltransferase